MRFGERMKTVYKHIYIVFQGALKAAKDAGWEKTRDIVNELENVLDKIKNVLSS